jgi:hypothetical protein
LSREAAKGAKKKVDFSSHSWRLRGLSCFVTHPLDRWLAVGLAALVLLLYAPSARFGLIWDDPLWYQQGAGQMPLQIFTALPTYQFYRPLAIWLNRQLVGADGVVNVLLAHLIQIAAHVGAVWLCAPALQALGVGRRAARLAALIFALNPLAFQAVAWQAPQQPLTTFHILAALVATHRFYQTAHKRWLALAGLAYVVALLFQESAVPFVPAFWWLSFIRSPKSKVSPPSHLLPRSLAPLLPTALAALYLLIWINVPRQSGLTGQGFQISTLAYGLQGVVFPWAHLFARFGMVAPPEVWLLIFGLLIALLLGAVGLWHGWRVAVLCAGWIGAGLLPMWAGLSWDYVKVGARLLYPTSVGIAALWACALVGAWQARWRGWCVISLVVGIGLGVHALTQWAALTQLYERGTQHLTQAVDVLAADPSASLVFVNFPDRIALRPTPYPLGVWGITLAPVIQNLRDFAVATRGSGGMDRSLAVFLVGAAERETWPYAVNMRGEDSAPATVLQAALQANEVYLTDYAASGVLRLRAVGAVFASPAEARPPLAVFGEAVELLSATVQTRAARLEWRVLQPLPDTAIFAHFWQDGAYIGGVDGDSLGDVLPLWAWQPNTTLIDIRALDGVNLPPGTYGVRVGFYNRLTQKRLPAYDPEGGAFPDHEAPIGEWVVP